MAADGEVVLEKMRAALKDRGSAGITGLARNFKICDSDGSRALDLGELKKCCAMCRLNLSEKEVATLLSHFDRDGNGKVQFDEFLLALRGKMNSARRSLVRTVFNKLDEAGDGNGYLTVDDLKDTFTADVHPEELLSNAFDAVQGKDFQHFLPATSPSTFATHKEMRKVKAGKKTAKEALTDFLQAFEGDSGNRDGIVTLSEWLEYYDSVSACVDSDDYFGEMIVSCWRSVPGIAYVPEKRILALEAMLKQAIYQKLRRASKSESRALEETFKSIDLNGNGTVSFDEFTQAMARYGLEASSENVKQMGGVELHELRALFTKYDTEGDGSLSYSEFAAGLYPDEKRPGTASTATSLSIGGRSAGGIAPSAPNNESRPGTASSYTRGRSIANPNPVRQPGDYTRSSGIFG